MTAAFDPIELGRRLEWTTVQTRLRLIESQLALGLTFCMVLETEIRLGEFEIAHQSLLKLEHSIHALRGSMKNGRGLPRQFLRNVREKLQSLERRVRAAKLSLSGTATGRRLQVIPWPLPAEYRTHLWG